MLRINYRHLALVMEARIEKLNAGLLPEPQVAPGISKTVNPPEREMKPKLILNS